MATHQGEVPKLAGLTLGAAKKALTKAHCATGKVKSAHSRKVKRGRIVKQSVAAGKTKPKGTKIALTESSGKPR